MISVIVPVYNVENYLEACLDSILASTYTDLELILIDDGSTDGSGRLCDEAANRDSRIKVRHQTKTGISASRNFGFDISSGEYVSFVDADDVVTPDMFQKLFDALLADFECDFSMGRALFFHDADYSPLKPMEALPEVHTFSQEQYMDYLFKENEFGYPVVWCKLFKREVIAKERFVPIDAEDIEWMTRICLNMNKVVIVEQPLYGYRIRPDSITRENGGINMAIVRRLDTLHMCLNHLPKNCIKYRSSCLLYIYKIMLNTRYKAHNTEFEPEVKVRMETIYRKTVNELMHCRLKLSEKVGLYCFYHLPWLYTVAFSLYAKFYTMTHDIPEA